MLRLTPLSVVVQHSNRRGGLREPQYLLDGSDGVGPCEPKPKALYVHQADRMTYHHRPEKEVWENDFR